MQRNQQHSETRKSRQGRQEIEEFTEVFSWGCDRSGQLGLGGVGQGQNHAVPRFCSYNIPIKQIACGDEHAAFITKNNLIYSMGSNIDGQLGIGDRSVIQKNSPVLVESLIREKPVKISAGAGHTLIATETGQVYSWGLGNLGQLGQGSAISEWEPKKLFISDYPSVFIIDVSCGSQHSSAVDSAGRVFTTGANDQGQLGTGVRQKENTFTPLKSFQERVISVASGLFHTLFLTQTGKIFATGCNVGGELGTGDNQSQILPVMIQDIQHIRMTQIAAGGHSAAISSHGELYIWGSGSFGEFLNPHRVKSLEGKPLQIELGSTFGCVIIEGGQIYAWGNNQQGQLGVGDFQPRLSPFPVSSLQGKFIDSVGCGGTYAIALGETQRTGGGSKRALTADKGRQKAKKSRKSNKDMTTSDYYISANKNKVSPLRTHYTGTFGSAERKNSGSRSRSPAAQTQNFQSISPLRNSKQSKQALASTIHQTTAHQHWPDLEGTGKSCSYVIKQLKLQKAQLQDELDAEQKLRKKLERDMASLQNQFDSIHHELITLRDANRGLEQKNHDEFATNQLMTQDYQDKIGENRDLKRIVDDERMTNQQIRDENAHLMVKVAQLEQDNSLLRMEHEKIDQQLVMTTHEKKALDMKVSDTLSFYEAKVNDLERDNRYLLQSKTDEIEKLTHIIQDLEHKLHKEAEDKARIDSYLKSELNKYQSLHKDQEHRITTDVRLIQDKDAIIERLQRESDNLISENAYYKEEHSKEKFDNQRLRDNLQMEQERANHNQKMATQYEGDLLNTQARTEERNANDSKVIEQLRQATDELKYQNEENRRLINVKQNEIDCLHKDVESWKEVVDRINAENSELKKIIEELEGKNKKLIETMNEHIYNKAQNYKQRTMDTLQRNHSPMRASKAAQSGIEPSSNRMNALADDEVMDTQKGIDNISRMVKFQADTHAAANPHSEQQNNGLGFDVGALMNKEPHQHPHNEVRSNYGVIKELDRMESAPQTRGQSPYNSGPGRFDSRPGTAQEMYNSGGAPSYQPYSSKPPQDSIDRLGSHMGMSSPIRKNEFDNTLRQGQDMYSPDPRYQPSPLRQGSSPQPANQTATTLASSMIRSSMLDMKKKLEGMRQTKADLERQMLDYEKAINS